MSLAVTTSRRETFAQVLNKADRSNVASLLKSMEFRHMRRVRESSPLCKANRLRVSSVPCQDKFGPLNNDGLVRSQKSHFSVIPAKAGIQSFQAVLDSRLRGSDDLGTFYELIRVYSSTPPSSSV